MKKPKEECGVFGVSLLCNEAVELIFAGLLALQHRGQESAGIAMIDDNNIRCHKDIGMVSEVFCGTAINYAQSKIAVGHVRYSTRGGTVRDNAGPFVREYLSGRIVVAHNGNITNAKSLKEQLKANGLYFKSSSDSEVVSALIANEICASGDIMRGVENACSRLQGAFSLIIGCGDGKLIAVRDPVGFRPLCIGESEKGIAVSSESCALDLTGFDLISDVHPGEIVLIDHGKIVSREVKLKKNPADEGLGLCVFEYIYFSRPDSIIDSLCVNLARVRMGEALAKESPVTADCVVGIPDSGLDAALGFSQESKIPLATGFTKNRYVGRSFILPTQEQRENIVHAKLNPLKSSVENKRIVLVDDSIVRGNTIARIVKSLRKAGAAEIHLRISSPPFAFTCSYGTDIDDEEDLIIRKHSIDEICKQIGADSLAYLSMEGLINACRGGADNLCKACFSGYGAIYKGVRKNELEVKES